MFTSNLAKMQVLFFDGECVLCDGIVQWVARKNTSENLKFASLQGTFAKQNLPDLNVDSIVFLDNHTIYIKSAAILKILPFLPGYGWFRIFGIFPLKFRDYLYDVVARNRFRWFGEKEYCEIPSKELRDRYISD